MVERVGNGLRLPRGMNDAAILFELRFVQMAAEKIPCNHCVLVDLGTQEDLLSITFSLFAIL